MFYYSWFNLPLSLSHLYNFILSSTRGLPVDNPQKPGEPTAKSASFSIEFHTPLQDFQIKRCVRETQDHRLYRRPSYSSWCLPRHLNMVYRLPIDPPKKKSNKPVVSSALFPVHGNVYPLGYYSVSLRIGNPPKLYDFDIDTGSDLTWVQCDAPCRGCTKPVDGLYKPYNNLVHCEDPLCNAIHSPEIFPCSDPHDQCDYEVGYADLGSSLGVLVMDYFPLHFTNGSVVGPRLAFGCGYDQSFKGHHSPPSTAGVLGLGSGKASILSQLHGMGLTRNIVGHCLSGKGGGYLFFGDDLVPSSGVTWTPMSSNSVEKHYFSGAAEIYFGGKSTGLKGLDVIFDSGSSYTYFSSKAYETIVKQLREDLKGKPIKEAVEDKSLPICWKGAKPFRSLGDVNHIFKPITLSFTNTKKAQLQLPPEAYLIITKHGNVCLGILDGAQIGLGNLNVIGDISLQDKMVIYDNENQQIGWISANCNRLPKSQIP